MHVMHKVIFLLEYCVSHFQTDRYISDSLKALIIIPMRFLPQLLHAGRKIMILIISSNRCLCSIFKKPWDTILMEHFATQYQLLLEKPAISY